MTASRHDHGFTHEEIAYGAFCIYEEEQRRGCHSGQDTHWFEAIERLKSIRESKNAEPKKAVMPAARGRMTIGKFKELIQTEAANRMGLKAYVDYIKRASRNDKYLREEYPPILAVVRAQNLPDSDTIELGNETQPWDARVNGIDVYEVIQALPEKEHEVRKAIVGDARTMVDVHNPEPGQPNKLPATGAAAQMILLLEHANDHLQFPNVIVDAINKKHKKGYADNRTLIVAVDGDYTGEDDGVIEEWLDRIRTETTLGNFKEIFLVEVARLKVFRIH